MASTDNKHNRVIIDAKKNVNDEFYTPYDTIEQEMSHHVSYFTDKTVYCNCDDPDHSNFIRYFIDNFRRLNLKCLYATSVTGKLTVYDGDESVVYDIRDGDMFADFCVDVLTRSDVVVTNPPFSRSAELLDLLYRHKKKFLLLMNNNTVIHRHVFPRFINREIWLGATLFTGTFPYFIVPDEFTNNIRGHYREVDGIKYKQVNNICWLTNIQTDDRDVVLHVDKKFDDTYVSYDDIDIINVDLVKNIPYDYDGAIGVPLTVLKYLHDDGMIHCEHDGDVSKYRIIGCMCRSKIDEYNFGYPTVNGKRKFVRIIIKINE